MEATTWRAATFGVRVGKPNAERYFDRAWSTVEVRIDGEFHTFKLSDTFWTTCPEFRGGPLPAWFAAHGLQEWPKRQPTNSR